MQAPSVQDMRRWRLLAGKPGKPALQRELRSHCLAHGTQIGHAVGMAWPDAVCRLTGPDIGPVGYESQSLALRLIGAQIRLFVR